ncbi:hypothetical protein [Maritimibacter sp. UBA3975]|uniref:hypothetical protein n=1 Tax=Maritimibacter sp. UBA3975 TaxID=1946833 RepID=UPI0025C474ED|nr:hypothetical protein [Maritimibacter sp. UBA3975]|tara:strand:+ start:22219 stop:22680 length:462 start_codon:yes stop_codon:yes gene_type:complete
MPFHIDWTLLAGLAADVLLAAGAIGAALYCIVLARRLKRFNNLENGVGGAVAVLSAQVDDMTKTLDQARKAAAHSSATLTTLTERAEDSARKLELMMASLHDLPDAPPDRRERGQDSDWMQEAQGRTDAAKTPGDEDAPLFSSKRGTVTEGAA